MGTFVLFCNFTPLQVTLSLLIFYSLSPSLFLSRNGLSSQKEVRRSVYQVFSSQLNSGENAKNRRLAYLARSGHCTRHNNLIFLVLNWRVLFVVPWRVCVCVSVLACVFVCAFSRPTVTHGILIFSSRHINYGQ